MPGYFPLSIPPSPPSINIISEISFTIISLSSTDKLLIIGRDSEISSSSFRCCFPWFTSYMLYYYMKYFGEFLTVSLSCPKDSISKSICNGWRSHGSVSQTSSFLFLVIFIFLFLFSWLSPLDGFYVKYYYRSYYIGLYAKLYFLFSYIRI